MALNIIQKNSTVNATSAPGRSINWIILHYTAGTTSRPGAALDSASWFSNPAAKSSADFICDDENIVQLNPNPRNYYCWAVGGSKYSSMSTSQGGKYYGIAKNSNSISIEMCSNKTNKSSLRVEDSDWYLTEATINNAAELTKYLMNTYNIDINHVIMHHHVTGKICPQPWTLNESKLSNWNAFLSKVQGKNVTISNNTTTSSNSNTSVTKNTNFPTVPFEVTVKVNDLNIRTSASSKAKSVGYTGKGSFTITKVENGWGKLKSGAGYIYLENSSYVTIGKSKSGNSKPVSSNKKEYKIKVTANSLNIRKGPGTNYAVCGSITDNGSYTIVEEQNGWGKLKSGAGYICLEYTRKI